MGLNPSNGSNLEQLAMKGLIVFSCVAVSLYIPFFTFVRSHFLPVHLSMSDGCPICLLIAVKIMCFCSEENAVCCFRCKVINIYKPAALFKGP